MVDREVERLLSRALAVQTHAEYLVALPMALIMALGEVGLPKVSAGGGSGGDASAD